MHVKRVLILLFHYMYMNIQQELEEREEREEANRREEENIQMLQEELTQSSRVVDKEGIEDAQHDSATVCVCVRAHSPGLVACVCQFPVCKPKFPRIRYIVRIWVVRFLVCIHLMSMRAYVLFESCAPTSRMLALTI